MSSHAAYGIVVLLCLSLGVLAAGEEDDWLAAFGHLEAGTRHWELLEFQEAAEEYRQGMELFREIHIRYPAWRTDVVLFRWAYCRAKLAECQKRLDSPVEAMPRQELENELRLARTAIQRLLKSLQERMAELKELESREKENIRLRKQAAELKAALDKAEKKCSRLDELTAENQHVRQELGRILAEYEDYRESIENAEHKK